MSTLASGGRISTEIVEEEVSRLRNSWAHPEETTDHGMLRRLLGEEQFENLDEFDRAQLVRVIAVCSRSRSLSEAGRTLFNNSRKQKSVANDADRLRKYLSRFGLDFKTVSESQSKLVRRSRATRTTLTLCAPLFLNVVLAPYRGGFCIQYHPRQFCCLSELPFIAADLRVRSPEPARRTRTRGLGATARVLRTAAKIQHPMRTPSLQAIAFCPNREIVVS